jgi:hypothetical protein
MFTDNGLPDLQRVQRLFHFEIMNGFINENERLIKDAMKNKKEEARIRH